MSGLWLGYKFGFCENKKTKKSVQCSKGESMTTRWMRGGNQAQGRKEKTSVNSYYLYTGESIECTNFRVSATPFACTLHAQL